MTSPRDETRYTFKVDERDASRGLKKLAEGMEDVDKLSAKLRKSQTLQADAAGKLRVAESRLTDLRQTGKAKASQLAQAEESVAAARRKMVGASDDARRSSLSLGRAQESNRRTSLLAARAQENARQATTSLATAQDGATRSSGRLHRAQDGAVDSSRRLRRATQETSTGFASVRKSVGGLSLGIGTLLGPVGLMAGAATAAGVGIVGLGIAAYKGAARLQLMDQKARVVFGRSFPELAAWAKTVSARMGLTSREVLGLAAGFSDMLVPMGFARDRAAQLGKRFASLIGPLSEWSNGTLDAGAASEALMGALTGEYDTLQRIGIPISAAAVETELLRRHQDKLTGSALDQAKATAALDIIYRGSTDAQKAYANGQLTLAARSKLAQARLGELRDSILVALIPTFEKVTEFAEKSLVPGLTGIGEGFRHVREQVGPVSLGLASFNTGVRDMGAAASGVAATVAPIGDVLTKVKLGGEGAGKALGPIGDLLIGLGGSAGGATAALEPMGDLLKTNNRGAEEFGKKVGAALRTLVDWSFKGAIGLVHLGEQGALGLASILEGFASVSIGMGNFLKDTYGTLTGVLGGFKILAKAIAPALVPKIEESERAMREFGQKAGQSMIDSGNKAKGMADTIRRNVPPAAAAAKAKLEDMRKSALGIPKSTLTRLDVAERTAQQKIAATKRQLQDPALTATRKAKLEADLRKWQAQLAQIQRDKARAAQAVRIPTGATAMPSRVVVVREKDRNGIITGIRFAGRGAFATGGRVFGAGTETSDSIPARLSKGEHVWTAREVRGAGGHSVVERMRKQAARAPGYATGGMVRAEDGSLVPASFYDPPPSGMVRAEDGSLVPKSFYGPIPLGYAKTRAQTRSGLKSAADAGLRAAVMSVMRDALKREGTGAFSPGLIGALNFAKAQVGSLYAWGKQGPRSVGYDCSGFQSAITRTARGQSPYVRLGSTASFPWSGFARGPGAYMIGSTPDAGGGIGHMAGTLNGVNVESRGGEGVVVGPRARGARAGLFGGNVWHLRGFARGGRVGDPPFDLLDRRGKHYQAELAELLMAAKRFGVKSYDQGGKWPSGTLGVNTSGGTETVLPPGPQRFHPADIQALGEVIGRVVVGGIRSNNVSVGRTADLILRGG